jgi:hypothetical protein
MGVGVVARFVALGWEVLPHHTTALGRDVLRRNIVWDVW